MGRFDICYTRYFDIYILLMYQEQSSAAFLILIVILNRVACAVIDHISKYLRNTNDTILIGFSSCVKFSILAWAEDTSAILNY